MERSDPTLRGVEGWDSKRFGGAPFIITFLFFFTASCEVLIFAFNFLRFNFWYDFF